MPGIYEFDPDYEQVDVQALSIAEAMNSMSRTKSALDALSRQGGDTDYVKSILKARMAALAEQIHAFLGSTH